MLPSHSNLTGRPELWSRSLGMRQTHVLGNMNQSSQVQSSPVQCLNVGIVENRTANPFAHLQIRICEIFPSSSGSRDRRYVRPTLSHTPHGRSGTSGVFRRCWDHLLVDWFAWAE